MKKYINQTFLITTCVFLIVSIGLLSYHVDYFIKYGITGSDLLRLIFMFVFLLLATIMYCVICFYFTKHKNFSWLILLKVASLIFLIISFILSLTYTIDDFTFYLSKMSLSWNEIFSNNELTTFMLTQLFATIFLFMAFVFVAVQVIVDIKNKNFPRIDFTQFRQSWKEKRRKHLQDKINKLDE